MINIYSARSAGRTLDRRRHDDDEGPLGPRRGAAMTTTAAPGLEGVVVAETEIGDVRGAEGFFHYRQYSAVELAERRTFEDVWYLMVHGELPDAAAGRGVRSARWRRCGPCPTALDGSARRPGRRDAARGAALGGLRARRGRAAGARRWTSTTTSSSARRCSWARSCRRSSLRRTGCAAGVGPARAAAGPGPRGEPAVDDHRRGADARAGARARAVPDPHRSTTASTPRPSPPGSSPRPAPTWPARSAAPIGALSGPLHGGAPSRALDMLDQVDGPADAEQWVRDTVAAGDRVMGFGHRVYSTDDPRSVLLRRVAQQLGGDRVDAALAVEERGGPHPGRAQARPLAVHQRRVLRRGGHGGVRPPPRDVHPDLRREPDRSAGAPTCSSRRVPTG